MRSLEPPDIGPMLGGPIRQQPPAPTTPPERWLPIESQPGYERNANGEVRSGAYAARLVMVDRQITSLMTARQAATFLLRLQLQPPPKGPAR